MQKNDLENQIVVETLVQKDYPNFLSIIDLFKKNVDKHPDKVAVVYNNSTCTYLELDQKSNQLASYLAQKNPNRGFIVACSLTKSIDLIVVILAVLKAGGIYLPIDPKLPKDRIRHIINDAKPQVFLTEAKHKKLFIDDLNETNQLLLLEQFGSLLKNAPKNLKGINLLPNQPAYIIYTSGSTGKPKGILAEHSGLVYSISTHYEHYFSNMFGLLTGSINFDASLMISLYLLVSSGTVFIPEFDENINIDKVVDFINHNSINFILCIPSFYSLLLQKEKSFLSLQIVSLVGENLPKSIPMKHANFSPNAILYNEYGPSECGIGVTIAKIYDPKLKEIYSINIGKPYRETSIFILDNNLNLRNSTKKGEICIYGPSVARGYLNNSMLTSEKFIIWNGKRIYRSGDYGCYLPDGNIQLLGRIDQQIKIRGVRVELGEIEHTICSHDIIKEAAVLAKKRKNGTYFLVAYYSTTNKKNIEEQLKPYLALHLPPQMQPSFFIHLESLPLTKIGKIDRKKLEVLPVLNNTENFTKLETLTEKTLFKIWYKLLGTKKIKKTDRFFDLGGDSLGLVSLQIMIEKELSLKFSISELLQYPSINELLNYLTQKNKPVDKSNFYFRAKKRKKALNTFKKPLINE